MDRLLIVGVDTVAGANLALSLAEKYKVSTWAPRDGYDIPNCDALDPADAPHQALKNSRPDWVLYCGPTARSAWDPETTKHLNESTVGEAHEWAIAAREANAKLLMISSDAIFTGPWMFHDEDSPGLCHSHEAMVIRATEDQVLEICPQALIIRTNVFGWSADAHDQGWIESLLTQVQSRRIVDADHIGHASPILATDLAEIVERACLENLTGIYHVGGAERVNPLRFTQRVADLFDLPWLAMRQDSVLTETPQGFAAGECSLLTKKIRKDLCVAMPMLSEGLTRLLEQSYNGYQMQLASGSKLPVIADSIVPRRVA